MRKMIFRGYRNRITDEMVYAYEIAEERDMDLLAALLDVAGILTQHYHDETDTPILEVLTRYGWAKGKIGDFVVFNPHEGIFFVSGRGYFINAYEPRGHLAVNIAPVPAGDGWTLRVKFIRRSSDETVQV